MGHFATRDFKSGWVVMRQVVLIIEADREETSLFAIIIHDIHLTWQIVFLYHKRKCTVGISLTKNLLKHRIVEF